jgi:hypothetical protein
MGIAGRAVRSHRVEMMANGEGKVEIIKDVYAGVSGRAPFVVDDPW